MAKYKLIEVIKNAEEVESQSIYDQDNLITASAKMHNDFGVAVKQDSTISAYAILIDNETGSKIDKLYWAKAFDIPIPDPEDPEPVDIPDVTIRNRVYTHNNYTDDNISAYESEQLAIGNYHTKIASQMNNSQCNFAITVRINTTGDFAEFDLFKTGE